MKTIIIAPHPDDEWIGCGCTILKKVDNKEDITILIITEIPRTKIRLNMSRRLAKKYKYKLKTRGMPELNIDEKKLVNFLSDNIAQNDFVYIPDNDLHPDHKKINKIVKNNFKKNILYEYATYNNSKNPFIRCKNKIFSLIYKRGFSSFKKGKADIIFKYKLHIKNEYISKFFEKPRDGDVLRCV